MMKRILAAGLIGFAGVGIFCGNVCYACGGNNSNANSSNVVNESDIVKYNGKNINRGSLFELLFDIFEQELGEHAKNSPYMFQDTLLCQYLGQMSKICGVDNLYKEIIYFKHKFKTAVEGNLKNQELDEEETKALNEFRILFGNMEVTWECDSKRAFDIYGDTINDSSEEGTVLKAETDDGVFFYIAGGEDDKIKRKRANMLLIRADRSVVDEEIKRYVKNYAEKSESIKNKYREIFAERIVKVERKAKEGFRFEKIKSPCPSPLYKDM